MAGFLGKSLGIFSASRTGRVYLAEKDVQVNKACKHFPTTPKRNVFRHDTLFSPTCWADIISEMKASG